MGSGSEIAVRIGKMYHRSRGCNFEIMRPSLLSVVAVRRPSVVRRFGVVQRTTTKRRNTSYTIDTVHKHKGIMKQCSQSYFSS